MSGWTAASFSRDILDCLEQKSLHYIIACRFNNRIKYSLTHEKVWAEVADGLEIAETTCQAEGWEKPRRIVMVRQEVEKRPNAAGKQVRQLELFEDEKDKHILRFARSLKTRQAFLAIWEKLKDYSLPYSTEKS